MKKVPTAEEFLNAQDSYIKNRHVFPLGTGKIMQQNMIKFAKLHVEVALKAASENAKIIDDPNSYTGNTGSEYPPDQIIDRNSIINAYLFDLIK